MARKKYKTSYDDSEGVWRTIGGRRVFIKTGQSLSEAMKDSGKFDNVNREKVVKSKQELKNRELHKQTRDMENAFGTNRYKFGENYWSKKWNEAREYEREGKELLDSYYDNPKEYKGDISDLKGKHMKENLGQLKARMEKPMKDENDWYYGKEAFEKYGSSIQDKFGGKEITKRIDKADTPTGLRSVAKEVGAKDEYDIVEALEGMARNGKAQEVSDGVFRINRDLSVKYDSVEDRYNKDKSFRDMLKKEHDKYNDDVLMSREEYERYASRIPNRDDYGATSYQDYINATKDVGSIKKINDSIKEHDKWYGKTPYNSKAYAKELSQIYNVDEEYEDKKTPKYIQDIDSARYGNMSDEQAIKEWIDGGADIIYQDDARAKLKEWGIPVKNDDPYDTYKNELAKQLLPIYRSDKRKSSLSKMGLGDLREMAQDYNINVKGLSRNDIIEKLLAMFNK